LYKKENIVIFPRYQETLFTSPADFTPNAAVAVGRALDTLRRPSFITPDTSKLIIIGHSYGGVISSNLALKYAAYGIPKPKAIFACAPGFGTAPQGVEPSYMSMASSIKILIVNENDDVVVGSTFSNILFTSTPLVSFTQKNLVTHYADTHGTAPVSAGHNECTSIDNFFDNGETNTVIEALKSSSRTDAVDYYCYWKLADALTDCAVNNTGCNTAFGDTDPQKFMGKWGDNVAIRRLEVRVQ
jgi:hypothetical protein